MQAYVEPRQFNNMYTHTIHTIVIHTNTYVNMHTHIANTAYAYGYACIPCTCIIIELVDSYNK